MDMSGWLVGVGIGAVAAGAAAWAWQRQRMAALARRLEASEPSRLDLEAHALQVDHQLEAMAQALARQQAALTGTPALPDAVAAAVSPVEALLRHLGDHEPVVIDPASPDWLDTEPSADAERPPREGHWPAFAETMPAEFADLPKP